MIICNNIDNILHYKIMLLKLSYSRLYFREQNARKFVKKKGYFLFFFSIQFKLEIR